MLRFMMQMHNCICAGGWQHFPIKCVDFAFFLIYLGISTFTVL